MDEWSDDGDGDGDGEEDVDERKPLEGMRLTSTGKLESANREEVRRMCSTLGATFEPVLAADATFLLADRTAGDKYRVSTRRAAEGRELLRGREHSASGQSGRESARLVARGREPGVAMSQVCVRRALTDASFSFFFFFFSSLGHIPTSITMLWPTINTLGHSHTRRQQ